MRVLVLTNLFPPDVLGGYEVLAQDLAGALRARGNVVDVLTTGDGTVRDGVSRTLRLSRRFGSPARADRARHVVVAAQNRSATLSHLENQGRPDVALVMSMRRLGLAPLRVLQNQGIPYVVTVNDDWPVAYARPPSRKNFALLRDLIDRQVMAFHSWKGIRVRNVIYLSQAVRDYVKEQGVCFPAGVVLPQGVDIDAFSPRPYRPISSKPTLLFVGRLHPSKAPDVAIDTVACLRRQGVDARLVIAGVADDPTYLAGLRASALRLGVSDHVQWMGMLDRTSLPDLYRTSDVVLFASKLQHEGQGLTWLEAMACGVPVVASPSGGAREFLDRHPVARRVESCTGECFAEAIIDLADRPERQRALVTAALEVARRHGTLEQYVSAVQAQLHAAARGDAVLFPASAVQSRA